MAMLRLASSAVVPNSLRAIPSPRNFSAYISNCITRNFSTDVKKLLNGKLVNYLKSEIKSQQLSLQKRKPSIPAHFPFTIHHHPGWDTNITLKRELDGEKIDVLLYPPHNYFSDSEDDSHENGDGVDEDSSSTNSNSDEQKIKSRAYLRPSLELNVKISKENGTEMEFLVSVSAAEIRINSMSVKEPVAQSDSLICYGPSPMRGSELQFALGEFLESRGIKKSYVKFLYKYGIWNNYRPTDVHSYEKLRMLKKFIKE